MKAALNVIGTIGIAFLACAPALATDGIPEIDAVLKPVVENGAVSAIDVSYVIDAETRDLTLTAPIVYPGVPGVADRMMNIVVSDAVGPIPFALSDDPPVPGGFPYFRHWKAEREVQYPVTVSYRSLVQPAGGPGGPPFGMRAVDGGVTGAGSGFWLLPEDFPKSIARVRWDLSALPAGSFAVTSFGEGTFELRDDPGELMQGWYLAGPAGHYPAKGDRNGFSAAWLGEPTFDAHAEMEWAGKTYAWLGDYFGYLDPAPDYRVFMRFLEERPFGGGTALRQSFMLSRGPLKPGETREAPRSTLFHEMIHQWVGGIEAPVGVSSWFSEGLTTYYTTILPMRGGYSSLVEYGEAINELTRDYFVNPARNWSADRIVQSGFSDEDIRHLPYQRGALYFADLDARIRAKSGGKRNLESLLFPLFEAREQGMTFDHARWIALVTEELGPAEAKRFESLILAGTATLEPAEGAFGPCFQRRATTFQVDGKSIPGFEWVRAPSIPDEQCRRW